MALRSRWVFAVLALAWLPACGDDAAAARPDAMAPRGDGGGAFPGTPGDGAPGDGAPGNGGNANGPRDGGGLDDGGGEFGPDGSSPSDGGGSGGVDGLKSRRLPVTIVTHASAAGYPAEDAIDDKPDTVWLASSTANSVNNVAWVELTLSSVHYVSRLQWRSPNGGKMPALYPASGPSNFHISVSSDGTTWSDVYAAHGSTVFDGVVPVGRPIRKLRVDVSKVNDGTGWALAFSEIWLEGRKETSADCTMILGPSDDYQTELLSLGAGPKTVCLLGGAYAGPLRIEDASDIDIRAYRGIPTITSVTSSIQPPGADTGTLILRNSSNINLRGVTVHNAYHVTNPGSDPNLTNTAISRAVIFDTGATGVHLRNCTLRSEGKQTALFLAGDHTLSDTFVQGYYFEIDARAGTSVTASGVTLLTDFVSLPKDAHSMVYIYDANLTFTDLSIIARTGRALLSGANTSSMPPTHFVKLYGTTKVGGMAEWVQVHPNYPNIRLELHGHYPTLTTYWQNPVGGGGPAPGTLTCFYDTADALINCE